MRSLPIALSAVFVTASLKPHFARSEIAVAEANHHHDLLRHLQQSVDDMTNSVTEGPVTLEQLQLVQTIIQELSKATLPEGVDLIQVNVAVIITQVLQELDIDASAMSGGGALSESEMSTVVQEIINKASEILGVTTSTTATATTATTTTTAAVAAESCSVCGEGFEVGNPLGILSLEGQPEVSCAALQIAGENGVIPSEQCAALPSIITDVCECIPSSSATTTTIPTTTTTDATTATTPSCVCSPLSYTFTINFSKTCETNTIAGNSGIDNAICQLNTVPPNDDSVDFSTLKVFDVQFLEVDTSGDLSVINQVDRFNVSLSDGDTITFDSVAAKLNPNEPLADQLNYVPGGVLLALRARSDGSTAIVTNRPTWTYTNSCESLPLSVGDAIDWVTLTDLKEASPAFCPAVTTSTPTSSPINSLITSSPTKSPSLAPVFITDAPITSSPTKSPSLAPVVTTVSPITNSPTKSPSLAPVATTDSPVSSSPTKSPSLAPVPDPTKEPTLGPTPSQAKNPTKAPTTSPTSFGKAAKSKAGKGTKSSKSDPLAKVVKEVTKSSKSDPKGGKGTKSSKSDPMAKVVKEGGKSSKSDPAAKAVKEGLGEGTKSSKSDQMAKTSKAADSVTTSVFAKTKQQKNSSKSSASLLFSKGSKSKEGGKQKQSKSASYSTKGGKMSDEAKAQKNSPAERLPVAQSLGLDI